MKIVSLAISKKKGTPKKPIGHAVIRMDHGEQDPVVPFPLAERSRDLIAAQGYQVEFHRYAMEHSLCPAQMKSLRSWLLTRLG